MARHIVVSFEDNNDAEQFIAALKTEGAVFFQDDKQHFKNINTEKTSILGVFAKPTKFCQCPYTEDMKTVRSANYGWYIHNVCNMPIPGHYQSALKNLMNPPDMDARKNKVFLGVREGETRWPQPTTSKKAATP